MNCLEQPVAVRRLPPVALTLVVAVAVATARTGSSGTPGRSTTLWVGRIAPTVEGPFIQQLLEACGKLREWKPVTEPESGKLKGFGFVTYEEPQGVLVALQVLNNLKLDGQELALKCNKVRRAHAVGLA
jgi:RNA-binding protein 25